MTNTQEPVLVRGVGFVLGRHPQMFIFSVLWSDSCDSLIYRTFQEFRQFHKTLKNTFPLEAGLLKSSDCVLPKFQDAFILLPSQRTRKGLARLQLLEAYCQKLLGATETVSRSEVVTGFFQPQSGDLEPVLPQHSLVIMPSPWKRPERSPKKPPALEPDIHTLEAQTFQCLDSFSTQDTRDRPFQAAAGEKLDVFLRAPTGWWLVENEDKQIAWFPAPYLEQVPPREECEEMPQVPQGGLQFCATGAYKSSREDELSVPAGAQVTVLKVSEVGWWQCRYHGRQGLLPAVLLHPCPDPTSSRELRVHLNRSLASPKPEPKAEDEASACEERRLGARRPPPKLPKPKLRSSLDSGSDDGERGSATPNPDFAPAVPARPKRGDILRSCCSVTRRAFLLRGTPGSPVLPRASGIEITPPGNAGQLLTPGPGETTPCLPQPGQAYSPSP